MKLSDLILWALFVTNAALLMAVLLAFLCVSTQYGRLFEEGEE